MYAAADASSDTAWSRKAAVALPPEPDGGELMAEARLLEEGEEEGEEAGETALMAASGDDFGWSLELIGLEGLRGLSLLLSCPLDVTRRWKPLMRLGRMLLATICTSQGVGEATPSNEASINAMAPAATVSAWLVL